MKKSTHSSPLLLVRRVCSQLCQLPFPELGAIPLIRKQRRIYQVHSSLFMQCGAPVLQPNSKSIRATEQASLATPYLLKFHSWDPSVTCKPAMFSARSYSCLKSASVILAED